MSAPEIPAAAAPPALPEARGGRRTLPRRKLGELSSAARDPLGILARQNEDRVPELVELRQERMAASPFAFYRGTAAIMAADHANDPHSGILVPSCGDAHVSNFGFYASPQRTLLFDLNDFDEAAWAPWEWDVKRLVTSVIIGGRATSRDDAVIEFAAREAVLSYARALKTAQAHTPMQRYFAHFDPQATSATLDKASRKALGTAIKGAEKRTGARASRRLTYATSDGSFRFREQPPLMTKVGPEIEARIGEYFEQYRRSVSVDVRLVLAHYSVIDVARRVVGVGSVGTRCYVVLLQDREGGLFILQVKEAGRSVLEEYGAIPQPTELAEVVERHGQGARIVGLQRILQAHSDPMLGNLSDPARGFYVRQFHDMKGGMDIETLEDLPFRRYAAACGVVLARAHAQAPTLARVVDYIGGGRKVTDAITSWAHAYADRSHSDHAGFAGVVTS
jgi:uncharacterized protein (DUF2252 family)